MEQYNSAQMAVSNQMLTNQQTRTPQLNRGVQNPQVKNRPGSKNMNRKEKSNEKFGRTFFHPPSGEGNLNSSQTSIVDPNNS